MKTFDDEVKILGINKWKLKYLWLPASVGLIFFLSWSVAIMPRVTDIQQYQNDTAAVKRNVSDLNQKRNYLESADENDLAQKETLLSQALPGDKNLYYLLTVVQSIAKNYGFVVDSFAVSPGKITDSGQTATQAPKNDSLTRVPVTISLLGMREGYLDLIDAVEHSLPLLSIDSFKMVSDVAGGIRLDLTVATYFSTDKFDIKVNNLKLSDLTLGKSDLATIATLSAYHQLDVGSILATGSGKTFTHYDRSDPFTP